jgi:hypothetical protein
MFYFLGLKSKVLSLDFVFISKASSILSLLAGDYLLGVKFKSSFEA